MDGGSQTMPRARRRFCDYGRWREEGRLPYLASAALYGFKRSIIAQYVIGRDNFKFRARSLLARRPENRRDVANAALGLRTPLIDP